MKKLLFKILIFSTPISIFLLPPMILLKISGENYTPIDDLIVENKKFLIGYLYNEDNYKYLKWKTLAVKPKYDVIALGSSRVLQFRENMFKNSFYNAGYTVTSISDFVPFLKSIPKEKYPTVLIIGLDQWMFNKNWDAMRLNPSKHSKFDNTYYSSPNLATIKSVWQEILNHEYNYTDLLTAKSPIIKIGLNAKIKNSGFRKDGSMLYGKQIYKLLNKDTSAKDFNFSNTFLRIKNRGARFQYGKSVNYKALLELQNTMSFCKANNIYVVAFLPPFANKVNEKMNKNGNYQYMETICK